MTLVKLTAYHAYHNGKAISWSHHINEEIYGALPSLSHIFCFAAETYALHSSDKQIRSAVSKLLDSFLLDLISTSTLVKGPTVRRLKKRSATIVTSTNTRVVMTR